MALNMKVTRSSAIKNWCGMLQACFVSVGIGGAAMAGDRIQAHGDAIASSTQVASGADSSGLSLSAAADEVFRRHRMLSQEIKAPATSDGACTLARSAQELAPLLAASLEAQRASFVSSTAGRGDTPALVAFGHRISHEDALLVGIGLHLGAEVAYSYVRYDEIADVAGFQEDWVALFRAVAQLWHNPTGWPVHIEQQTDVTGCHDPGALIEPLEQIALAWNAAPECVRSVVGDAVRRSVHDALSDASCYCRAREQVLVDTARIAEQAGTFELGLSKSETDAIAMHPVRDDVRFECLAN